MRLMTHLLYPLPIGIAQEVKPPQGKVGFYARYTSISPLVDT